MNHSHTLPSRTLPPTDLPLDQVLPSRHPGKKIPPSSSSQRSPSSSLPGKNKPISKDKNDHPILSNNVINKPLLQQQQQQQENSADIARELVLNHNLTTKEIEALLIRLKNIKRLKYDKLSERIRESLVQVPFKHSYTRFLTILEAYSQPTISPFLLLSIFTGFQLSWRTQAIDSMPQFLDLFHLYCTNLPNCLNKRFLQWMVESSKLNENPTIYNGLRKEVLGYVNEVVRRGNRGLSRENEKIIGLIVCFELMDEVDSKMLVRIVPLEKINQYMKSEKKQEEQKTQKKSEQPQLQKQQKPSYSTATTTTTTIPPKPTPTTPTITVPPLIHASILQLIKQNNLKQVQKLIRSNKIPYTHYPELVYKLQMKYLEYVERTYPIFFVDQLIHGKMDLVEKMVDLSIKRRKYENADHFVHKYRLRGVGQGDKGKVFINPLRQQDCFGPTQSHVLNNCHQHHFLRLLDFDIPKSHVVWVDSKTIHQKHCTQHLKNLLYSKEVGLDSESFTGIHVFQKSKLQLIQVYEPESNVVLLFDVKDFKVDKKRRVRERGRVGRQEIEEQKGEGNKEKREVGRKMEEAIVVEEEGGEEEEYGDGQGKIEEEKQQRSQSYNNNSSRNINNSNTSNQQQQQPLQQQQQSHNPTSTTNKTWYYFTKVLQNVLKHSTIFGHVLHSDLTDIIQQLNLPIKPQQITVRDSQTEFKKHFPQQTKSKLGFLAEKCFNKDISKYEQCSAWDKRPLRDAQKHYAALDAVLPWRLVKWMEANCKKEGNNSNRSNSGSKIKQIE